MMKINTPSQWVQGQLVGYDKDGLPTRHDLLAALAISYLELSGQLPKDFDTRHVVNPSAGDHLIDVYRLFVSAYEVCHGPVMHNGRRMPSIFPQVKISAINDMNSHIELMARLYTLLERLP